MVTDVNFLVTCMNATHVIDVAIVTDKGILGIRDFCGRFDVGVRPNGSHTSNGADVIASVEFPDAKLPTPSFD